MDTITVKDLYDTAADLLSEDAENPEYDRALSELVASLDGVEGQDLPTTAANVLETLREVQAEHRIFDRSAG